MPEDIKMFKKKIYNEIVIYKECAIHKPHSFQQFCVSTEATKMFKTILNSVTNALQ